MLKGVRRAVGGSGGIGNVVGPASSTDEAVARFDGATGQLLQNSLFLISDTGVASGLASLSIGGATIGTNALAVTGTSNVSGIETAGGFVPSGTVVLTRGMYITGASNLAFSTNATQRWTIGNTSGNWSSSATNGPILSNMTSSATVPTVNPTGVSTEGLGGAPGVPAIIVGSATIQNWDTNGAVIASGKRLTLGNAATTGLVAGVLAATTNASIVITDSTGQAYRIPCII